VLKHSAYGIYNQTGEDRPVNEPVRAIVPWNQGWPWDYGDCGQPGQLCDIYKAVGSKTVPVQGCRQQRLASSRALRIVLSQLAVGDPHLDAVGTGRCQDGWGTEP
jgi:hypothetical protein